MIASGLLNFQRCCALILEGKSQVGIIPICVSSEGRMMACCAISHNCCALRLEGKSQVGKHSYTCLLGRAYNAF
jgi:hypothetical protein